MSGESPAGGRSAAVDGAEDNLVVLRESEQRLRAMVESTTDAVVSADDAGRIVFWNAAAERLFGHTAAAVLGQPLGILMPEPLRDLHEQGLRRYAATGQAGAIGRTLELDGLRADGKT